MKSAGIREARQGLSSLVAEVRKGREIVLTEHGRPVARLVPLRDEGATAFHSHRRFRTEVGKQMGKDAGKDAGLPLSSVIAEDREDRS